MKKLLMQLFVCIIVCGLPVKLQAQCPPVPPVPPLPEMFMFIDKGQEILAEFSRDRTFSKSKFTRINAINTIKPLKPELVFRWKAFENLVAKVPDYKRMRIHFAVYQQCNITPFPTLEEPTIILLFSPEAVNGAPEKFYFINENDENPYLVPNPCAASWIANFERVVQPELRKTISSTNPDNEDQTVPDKYSDTKSILYTKEQFESAFIAEQVYQRAHHAPITAIKINYSAYTKSGRVVKPSDPNKELYKKRLLVQFNYMSFSETTGKDEMFDLQEQDEFQCRFEATAIKENPLVKDPKELELYREKRKKVLDNGQLCPTHCP